MRLVEQRNLEYIDWAWLQNPNSELYKHLEVSVTWYKSAIQANQSVLNILKKDASRLIELIEST
tara:strand:- start:447 stop:638 length:192 start_codon:yes stop_codon:yes gene_type:complete